MYAEAMGCDRPKDDECGQETSIEARKVNLMHIVLDLTSTSEHIQAFARCLGQDGYDIRDVLPIEWEADLHAGFGVRLPQLLHCAGCYPESDGSCRRYLPVRGFLYQVCGEGDIALSLKTLSQEEKSMS